MSQDNQQQNQDARPEYDKQVDKEELKEINDKIAETDTQRSNETIEHWQDS